MHPLQYLFILKYSKEQGVIIFQPVPLSSLPILQMSTLWSWSCNFHSILRSTMATETSDSINLAYEFALRPQKCILSTFNLKGHMLFCTSVTMNWIRGSIWIGKAVMLWLISIHASVSLLQIIKWQKLTHVFFFNPGQGWWPLILLSVA